MDDIDPDILAITVHGTQSISLKEDSSVSLLNAVKVKCEFGDDVETQDIPRQIDLKLLCKPLVYTTRLDDMNALNKFAQYSCKQVTDMILAESKPRYEYLCSQVKRENDSCFTSYIQLSARVHQLNYKARIEENLRQHEVRARNEKLLKACKPLRIVLEDMNKKQTLQVKSEIKVKLSPAIDNIKLFSDEDLPSVTPFIKLEPNNDVFVTIKEKSSQDTDVYVVGAMGLKKYFKTDVNDFNSLQEPHKNKKILALEYCCWVEREKRITLLAKGGTFGMTSKCDFLRNAHSCPPGLCLCCCRKVSVVHKNITNDILNQNKTEIFPKTANFTDKIIQKATNYKIQSVPKTLIEAKHPESYVARSVIIIKYKGLLLQQTKKLGEHYEIGPSGNIDRYVIPTVNHTVTEQINMYRRSDILKMVNRFFYFDLICCWHKRQNFLAQIKNLKPSVLKFIKSSHLCGTENCECCCKPVHIITPLENVYKSNLKKPHVFQIKHITNKIPADKEKRPVLVQSFENILRVDNTVNTLDSNPPSSPVTESNVPWHRKSTLQINKSSNTADQLLLSNTIQDNIDLTIDANFTPPPIQNIREQANSNVPNQVIPEGLESTILNGVLGRFKDLKLVAGQNGKLSAMINAAPGSMTSVEIKVLSDILSLASVQIAQMGITAEEFCNRVNTSRANGQIGLPVPQLVPIVNTKSFKPLTVPPPPIPPPTPPLPAVLALAPPSVPLPKTKVKAKATPKASSKATPTVTSKKAQREPKNPPQTCDKGGVGCIYESMSSLGGKKNSQFVFAYHLYFKRKSLSNFSPQQSISTPTITDVRTLSEDERSDSRTSKLGASKRANRQQASASNKKQCVQPLVKILPRTQETPVTQPQPNLEHSAPPIDTAKSTLSQQSTIQHNNIVSQSQPTVAFDDNTFSFLLRGSCNKANIEDGRTPLYATVLSDVPSGNVSIPVQTPIYTAALNPINISAPAPNQNPLLYSLITQRSQLPSAVKPLPNGANRQKIPVAPLILAQSKANPSSPPKRKRRKLNHNVRKELQKNDAGVEQNNINIKSENNFVNVAPYTIINTDPITIDDDDNDNDCIFGV